MHEQLEKTCLAGCPFPVGELFLVWVSGCRLSAVTIASLLMGGCGLSHKCVEGGCKSTCVKFGGLTTQQNWGYGKFNACIG